MTSPAQAAPTDPCGPFAVAGGGSIGVAFAVVFARAGAAVRVFEPDPARRAELPKRLRATLDDLHGAGLLAEAPATVAARVSTTGVLAEAVAGAAYVQECAPEDRALKRALFEELDRVAPAEAILASASSAMPISEVAAALPGRARCLVAHPGNPPFLLRVIELVPGPFTRPAVVDTAARLLAAVGMAPVRLGREVRGFVFNRLQGAVLREAYCLVRDGVASVEDIDRVMREGLGLRWAVVGPFETVDLNTVGGIEQHAAKLGPAYAAMGAERGQDDPWTPELVASVTAQRRELLPLSAWDERVRWRDRMLMRILSARAAEDEG